MTSLQNRASALLRAMRSRSVNFYGNFGNPDIAMPMRSMVRVVQTEGASVQRKITELIDAANDAVAQDEDPPILDLDGYQKVSNMITEAVGAFMRAMDKAISKAGALR